MFSTVMLHQVIHGDGTGAAGVRLGPVYVAVSSLIKVYEGSKTMLLAKPQALLPDDELWRLGRDEQRSWGQQLLLEALGSFSETPTLLHSSWFFFRTSTRTSQTLSRGSLWGEGRIRHRCCMVSTLCTSWNYGWRPIYDAICAKFVPELCIARFSVSLFETSLVAVSVRSIWFLFGWKVLIFRDDLGHSSSFPKLKLAKPMSQGTECSESGAPGRQKSPQQRYNWARHGNHFLEVPLREARGPWLREPWSLRNKTISSSRLLFLSNAFHIRYWSYGLSSYVLPVYVFSVREDIPSRCLISLIFLIFLIFQDKMLNFWLPVKAISYWQRIQLGPRGLQPFTKFQDGSTKCVDMTVMLWHLWLDPGDSVLCAWWHDMVDVYDSRWRRIHALWAGATWKKITSRAVPL